MLDTKISVVYVTKNSQAFVGYSVAALLPYVDEVIVADEESTDNTIQIVESLQSPKIKILRVDMSDKQPGSGGLREATSSISGNVMMKVDDDWIWDRHNASQLPKMCHEGREEGKWGLRCRSYDIADGAKTYVKTIYKPYVKFQEGEEPFTCYGSPKEDNLMIYRPREISTWNEEMQAFDLKIRSRYYKKTSLFFTHWKWIRDTKEYFFWKWTNVFAPGESLEERKAIANQKWTEFRTAPRHKFDSPMPEVFEEYREQFTPLGGFDIRSMQERVE